MGDFWARVRARIDAAPRGIYHPTQRPRMQPSLQIEQDATTARFVGFASRAARLVKYLRAVDTGGSALKMFVHASALMNAADFVTASYIAYDIERVANDAPQGLKVRQATQQAAYQAVASLVVPTMVLNASMPVFDRIVKAVSASARLQKYGPPTLGVCVILVLPAVTDVPVEKSVEAFWHVLWPVQHSS